MVRQPLVGWLRSDLPMGLVSWSFDETHPSHSNHSNRCQGLWHGRARFVRKPVCHTANCKGATSGIVIVLTQQTAND
jgi:hypothetical protein